MDKFTRRAKPIQIIGHPDNQRPDKWSYIVLYLSATSGDRGGTLVKVLRYKSEGRWFDSRWCHWNFSLT